MFSRVRVFLLVGLGMGASWAAQSWAAQNSATQTNSAQSAFASIEQVKAPTDIHSAFTVSPSKAKGNFDPPLTLNKVKLSLNKSALEKEFLLQGAFIPQPAAAMGNGIKSRVVAFRQRDGKLYMLEATQGHSVTTDLPQNLILAEMPIVEETDTSITFDFNKGMSNLFFMGDWSAHDLDGADYDEGSRFSSVKVNSSFIESAEMTANNHLVIRQIAQLLLPYGVENFNLPVEVKYYLSPYNPSADFKPVESIKYDRTGYFEVAGQLTQQGTVKTYASKFNLNKPIVYAVSSNTPAEFKQAVKDGILYWNTVAGRTIVEAIDAPEGVVAPDINYNVIQWVPYDQAGFAYADAQMDPRTGEILHAQVYLTSAFAYLGVERAKALYLFKNDDKKSTRPSVGLKGLSQAGMCDFDSTEAIARSFSTVMAVAGDDAKYLRLAQDYVRQVTAHEVLHTAGLRHNFAGSLSASYPLA
ncbi:MAG: hypothetical protein C5B49_07975, partial [Bdellovibrio sp.]